MLILSLFGWFQFSLNKFKSCLTLNNNKTLCMVEIQNYWFEVVSSLINFFEMKFIKESKGYMGSQREKF
jgi:hypothetical protein